jgi:hypothetical protein
VLRMLNRASAIYGFGTSPKADNVPPNDPIFEIPFSELQGLLNEMVLTYNQIAETVRDAGILRRRELARMLTRASDSLKATRSPIEKLQLINAYFRQLLTKIREALKTRPQEGGKVIQVCSKIMARAVQIVDYIKTITQDDPKRKERAEVLWPALRCGHRPNDGRQTTRLIAKLEELKDSPIIGYRDLWQRSGRDVSLSI